MGAGRAGGAPDDGATYSLTMGSIYIFNLIVGAGALALPQAFSEAGWVGGSVLLGILALASAVTSTFMVEAMSISNALTKVRTASPGASVNHVVREEELTGLLAMVKSSDEIFHIGNRAWSEMAYLAGMFFSPLGEKLFYVTMIVYLYGDLCIYAVAVPKSLVSVACDAVGKNQSQNQNLAYGYDGWSSMHGDGEQWGPAETLRRGADGELLGYSYGGDGAQGGAYSQVYMGGVVDFRNMEYNKYADGGNHTSAGCLWGISDQKAYYFFLGVFTLTLAPFAYFEISKTKLLQMFTTVMRYATFFMLMSLCIVGVAHPDPFAGPDDHIPTFGNQTSGAPPAFKLKGMTIMFGVSVYSFMCQHSLPSLISPIKNQSSLSTMIFAVFIVVAIFYYALVFTAIIRFPRQILESKKNDVYTLVFADYPVKFCSFFLRMFPVFVLSTNFPIIAITLRNNLATLGVKLRGQSSANSKFSRLLYPTLAIGPPIIVAFFTQQVEVLISFTGSYAGVGIQYVIPALACHLGRQVARREFGEKRVQENVHRSVFGTVSVYAILVWSVICIGLVTYNHVEGALSKNATHNNDTAAAAGF